jgi:hypothetical protein
MSYVEFGPHSTALLNKLLTLGGNLVTALTDLQAAQTALDTEIQTALSDLTALGNEITSLVTQLANAVASNNPTAIAAVTADLQAQTASLGTALATAMATIPATAAVKTGA